MTEAESSSPHDGAVKPHWTHYVTTWGVVLYTVVTFVILVLGIVQYGSQHRFNKKQLRDIRSQLDLARSEFETSQRPWVYSVTTIAGPLHVDANGLTVTLQFQLKNVGHSPAVRTHIEPNIFLRHAFIQPLTELKRVCNETRNRAWSPDEGFTLFPGDIALPVVVTFSTQPNQMAEARKQGDHESPFVLPYIIGCVDYGFPFSPGHHQTAFIYRLAKIVPGRPPGGVAISVDDGDIPAENLRLLLDPFEGTGPID